MFNFFTSVSSTGRSMDLGSSDSLSPFATAAIATASVAVAALLIYRGWQSYRTNSEAQRALQALPPGPFNAAYAARNRVDIHNSMPRTPGDDFNRSFVFLDGKPPLRVIVHPQAEDGESMTLA